MYMGTGVHVFARNQQVTNDMRVAVRTGGMLLDVLGAWGYCGTGTHIS